MMKFLPALLILVILLTACGADSLETGMAREGDMEHDPEQISAAMLEGSPQDGLTRYPLDDMAGAAGISLGEDRLLLFCSWEHTTDLLLLELGTAALKGAVRLPFPIQPDSVQPWGDGISCYDLLAKEVVVLSAALEEEGRIPVPEEALGPPLLSGNGERLFYCTGEGLRVLEVTTGIRRMLKQTDGTRITLKGVVWNGEAVWAGLAGTSGEQTVLISGKTGELLWTNREGSFLEAGEDFIYTSETGVGIYGSLLGRKNALYPSRPTDRIWFLAEHHGAVTVLPGGEDVTILEYYDLTSGLRTGILSTSGMGILRGVFPGAEGTVWFLEEDHAGKTALLRWDPRDTPAEDPLVYTDVYYPRESPDTEGLKRCESYGEVLAARYGIAIRMDTGVASYRPEGWDLEYEQHVPYLMRTLRLLEKCLAQYPAGFVETVARRFEGLTICLVHGIREEATGADLDALQFWDGNHAVMALAVGSGAEGGFYHQFCHLIDTVVLNESSAYDTWQSLNPTGFRYDYSYSANRSRNSTAYLQEANRSFVDMFSMSFPREDRARIMEYAMLPGMEGYFRSDTMQGKLSKLCLGIRESFGLTGDPGSYLWEQYLES